MLGAEFACKPWRSVALEEPSLWRRLGMEKASDKHWRWRHVGVEMAMKLVAVDRAAGECEAFKGDFDDEYLPNLVERGPSLKCLHIDDYYNDYESYEGLVEALMKLPILEELQVYFSNIIEDRDENMLQSICKACPHLNKLILMYAASFDLECNEDEYSKERIDGEIPLMPKLHTLKLYECELKGEGLKAILDSCPVLETLHIDGYFDKCEMDKELRMKCARVKNLTLPTREWSDIYDVEEEY
ncbi:hypothetical protein PVAP13_6KG300700 [Panicum virgatum]|uniref:F-box/LRR-repeat protein 23 n=2 Tax=Panicum virgatum TaxID=38727 RepID=A0A8T0RGV1_PANVG|nr:hypothetical protein PVAP13_6KG300700 [Panicum virgatum]